MNVHNIAFTASVINTVKQGGIHAERALQFLNVYFE
jgi:hypothetical protein